MAVVLVTRAAPCCPNRDRQEADADLMAESPLREHPCYGVAYLTELHTNTLLGDGRQAPNPRRPSEAAGGRPAAEIQIELT